MYGQINDTKHTKTFISCPFGNSLDLRSVGDLYCFCPRSILFFPKMLKKHFSHNFDGSVGTSETRLFLGLTEILLHQEIPGNDMEIILPLCGVLGIIWRFQYHQEIPWGLFGDLSTTRKYMQTIGRLYHQKKPWGLYGDCSTTRRYPEDYMEIVAPWRYMEILERLYDHQEIPGYYIDISIPLGDSLGIIWRLQHHQEIPGDHRQIAVPLRDTLVIIWRLNYHLDIYPRDYLEM